MQPPVRNAPDRAPAAPVVSRALLAVVASVAVGALAAYLCAVIAAAQLGTIAAVALGGAAFVVVTAVALVAAARLDAGLDAHEPHADGLAVGPDHMPRRESM